MQARRLVMATLGVVCALTAAAPAFADRDDWRRRECREHEWREHHLYEGPPVVYVAPPVYRYYAPPPVYYGPYGYRLR